MKKFSRILEQNNKRFWKVESKLDLLISAENAGEAGYIADSVLAGNEYTSDYIIIDIKEEQNNVSESKSQIKLELSDNNYQMVSGIIDILKKVKDEKNRIEIGEDMVKKFKKEGIDFDYEKFLNSIK